MGIIGPGGGGDVSSDAVIADNAIVRGDGGVKNIQDSQVSIDDAGKLTGSDIEISNGDLTVNPGLVAAESYLLTGRTSVGFPVALFIPTQNNSWMVFDIYPKGVPAADQGANTGVAWFDICHEEVTGSVYQCLRMGIKKDGSVHVGSAYGAGGSATSLTLQKIGGDVGISKSPSYKLDIDTGDVNISSGILRFGGVGTLAADTIGAAVVNSSLTSVGALTGLTVNGARNIKRTASAIDYNPSALTSDYLIAITDTSIARAVTISTEDIASGSSGNPRVFVVKDESGNAGTNNITVSGESGNIDGGASVAISQNHGKLKIYADGSNLFTI